jgi:hypothetical protein
MRTFIRTASPLDLVVAAIAAGAFIATVVIGFLKGTQ